MPAGTSHPAPSYIVRIYRHDRAAQEITGIVEIPEYDRHLAFRSFAELKTILTRDEPDGPPGVVNEGEEDPMRATSMKVVLTVAIVAVLVLAGCGGGGGGGAPAPAGSSNWDEMVWDRDNWS